MNLRKYINQTPPETSSTVQTTKTRPEKKTAPATIENRDQDLVDTNQIKRIDGKGCFLEVLRDGFQLKSRNTEGKVHLNLATYDQNRRQTQFGQFWLSYTEWLILDEYFHSADFPEEYVHSVEEAQNSHSKYPGAIREFMRGSGEGNQVISRTLRICPGQKGDSIVIQYLSGPGEKTSSGIIKPKGKANVFITVPVTIDEWMATIRLVNQEIVAHKTAELLVPKLEGVIDLLNMMPTVESASTPDLSILESKIDKILQEME